MTLPIQNTAAEPHVADRSTVVFSDAPQIRKEWMGERTDYPRDKTIAQLFEEVAAQYPASIAAVCGSRKLTYLELNAAANSLAH